jgi:arylsulfatase A-like enzyme
VGAIDLAPTLYALAGRDRPADVDGVSLTSLLEGDPPKRWRDDLLIEYRSTPSLQLHTFDDVRSYVLSGNASSSFVPDYRSLRTTEWQYIEWYSGDEHEYELYDVDDDPYQLHNLVADPTWVKAHQDLVDGLQGRLEELAECTGASCRTR